MAKCIDGSRPCLLVHGTVEARGTTASISAVVEFDSAGQGGAPAVAKCATPARGSRLASPTGHRNCGCGPVVRAASAITRLVVLVNVPCKTCVHDSSPNHNVPHLRSAAADVLRLQQDASLSRNATTESSRQLQELQVLREVGSWEGRGGGQICDTAFLLVAHLPLVWFCLTHCVDFLLSSFVGM